MLKIKNAQANQTTTNGLNSPWTITLNGIEYYSLPSHFSPEETFLIRDIVEKMMKIAEKETKEQEQQLNLVKLNYVTSNNTVKFDTILRENERLADALQQQQQR